MPESTQLLVKQGVRGTVDLLATAIAYKIPRTRAAKSSRTFWRSVTAGRIMGAPSCVRGPMRTVGAAVFSRPPNNGAKAGMRSDAFEWQTSLASSSRSSPGEDPLPVPVSGNDAGDLQVFHDGAPPERRVRNSRLCWRLSYRHRKD